ncbi:Dak1-domain-containing protein [Aulographum hederae CBS 113979]|uniref:Dak1-domain-containing protein n=1 Tax=Aulographum hederae CBS 113979 TaxID=1176131 RepID=A0A6G1H9L3_9PEZI|nr:Dak1-domain-containing protein [Aulographum hederae CBS 113979]
MPQGKHFINTIDDPVVRVLRSLLATNPSLRLNADKKVLFRQPPQNERKVILISGGGSGHEPAHAGFVGDGMLDVAVAGNIFASPSAPQISAGLQSVNAPLGALIIVKNYTGDMLNFGLAAEKAKAQGRDVRTVMVADDVSIKGNELVGQRGLAGVVFVHKIAGAAAAKGMNLEEVARIGQKTADSLITVAASLDRCSVPRRGEQEGLAVDELEYGMGIHNEPGAKREKITSLQEIVGNILSMLFSEQKHSSKFGQGKIAVMINNLGGLSVLELSVIADEVLLQLSKKVSRIHRVFVGTFVTSLDGPGVSITLCKLDDESESLLDAPTAVNAWPKAASSYSEDDIFKMLVSDSQDSAPAKTSSISKSEALSKDVILKVFKSIKERVRQDEPLITKYDTIAGDGDCGETLLNGVNALSSYWEKFDGKESDLQNVFLQVASNVESSMGGTSGAIYAIFFNAVSRAVAAKSTGSSSDHARVTADALKLGLDDLCRYTSARVGHRTLMDALIPFVEEYSKSTDLKAAIAAATTGAEKTRKQDAILGRASYVDSEQLQAESVPDPGALGVVSILNGIAASL